MTRRSLTAALGLALGLGLFVALSGAPEAADDSVSLESLTYDAFKARLAQAA
ncbi:MAG: hypothetical protein U0835_11665 [Isosphaeraceae bacterium]